jgi:hypothetical protein
MSGLSAELASVNSLARIRRRCRCVRFGGISGELSELVAFCGLSEPLGIEPRRQPEEREERLRVEEERELGDATVQ